MQLNAARAKIQHAKRNEQNKVECHHHSLPALQRKHYIAPRIPGIKKGSPESRTETGEPRLLEPAQRVPKVEELYGLLAFSFTSRGLFVSTDHDVDRAGAGDSIFDLPSSSSEAVAPFVFGRLFFCPPSSRTPGMPLEQGSSRRTINNNGVPPWARVLTWGSILLFGPDGRPDYASKPKNVENSLQFTNDSESPERRSFTSASYHSPNVTNDPMRSNPARESQVSPLPALRAREPTNQRQAESRTLSVVLLFVEESRERERERESSCRAY
ncbi:hypothetical protein CpipJ_CPIJ004801 [Culex quinquefasciatus]|uniref:Uncharacterized protein n=1 Tax=Culex quinquefasciatus TaxID=7176 RepID=B0WCH7_CULQU|nr:hypothetical protein CpipJ_CPIJ004801 [Culex quinquefasciatus]|eukprot:XP_001846411.1 hypothetical protein CpipJ_CPIJ004801 [Culex quinquefasciatus]